MSNGFEQAERAERVERVGRVERTAGQDVIKVHMRTQRLEYMSPGQPEELDDPIPASFNPDTDANAIPFDELLVTVRVGNAYFDLRQRAPAPVPVGPNSVCYDTPVPQVQSSRAIVAVEPPHGPNGEIRMARRRGQQKGYLRRTGKAWYLTVREDALDKQGKIVRVRRTQKITNAKGVSKREAQRIAREILREVDQQAQRPYSLLTVAEFIENRFQPDVVWALKHAGQKHYKYILEKHVIPGIGSLRLRDVTSDQVQALVRTKIEKGYSVQTAVHIRNAISAVFNHAKLKRAYSGENPVEGVRLPEMQRKEAHALTFEQGRAVLSRLRSPCFEMALLSMTGSLNVAEMLGLRWKRVNLTGESTIVGSETLAGYTVAVRENYYRGKFGSVKAKSRRRNVPLGRCVVAALLALRSRSKFTGPDDLVFASRNGTPLNENNLMRRVIKPVAKALGMPWLSWHVFRHTHATLGEHIGMALSDRQAQMGHGDVRMTMHYTHSDLERRRSAVETMSDLLVGQTAGRVN